MAWNGLGVPPAPPSPRRGSPTGPPPSRPREAVPCDDSSSPCSPSSRSRTRRLAARARQRRRHPARAEGRGHRRSRGGPQRALQGRRRRDRADRSEVHLERRAHQEPPRDVGRVKAAPRTPPSSSTSATATAGRASIRRTRRTPRTASGSTRAPAPMATGTSITARTPVASARSGSRRMPSSCFITCATRRATPNPVCRPGPSRLEGTRDNYAAGFFAGGRPRGHRRRLAPAHRLHRPAVHEAPVDPRPVLTRYPTYHGHPS